MRGRKKHAATFASAGLFLLMAPLMCTAVAANAPKPETAAYMAAMLVAGEFVSAEKAAGSPKMTAEAAVDKPLISFAFDDSFMLSFGDPDVPSSADEEKVVSDSDYEVGDKPYPENIDSRDGAISVMSFGFVEGDDFLELDHGQVRNITHVSNDDLLAESGLAPDFDITLDGSPQVLIMHTHATESYEPYERDFYDESFNSRTTDPTMNMIAVGDEIAEELESAGIGVIHDTTLHDYPSYNGSYERSRETVKKYLEEYPSIKIVLDVHRDAIERDNGERVAPVAEIDGKNAAQVMIISGCDDGTMGMPDYMKNFRFASLLQNQLESDWKGLTRPVLFDYRKYNQDLTTGSILIEVGGHANSIDQALYSGELIGKSLVNILT